jgi:hypothetical protein
MVQIIFIKNADSTLFVLHEAKKNQALNKKISGFNSDEYFR